MYNFLYKSTIFTSIRASASHKHPYLKTPTSLVSLKCLWSSSNQHSFTLSYLINTYGLSPKSALYVSKRVQLDNAKRADSVLRFFERHGFSKNVVSKIVCKNPEVLLCHPGRTLLPKFEFFYSKGVSSVELADIVCGSPSILQRSLKYYVVPVYEFVNDLVCSEEKTNDAIRLYPSLLNIDLGSFLMINVRTMREVGAPGSIIVMLLRYRARVFNADPDVFRETVEEVKAMGFNPLRSQFVVAVWVMRSMTKFTWEKKVGVYRKWGWTEEEVREAFLKYPWCMTKSKGKIDAVMGFLVKDLGLKASDLAKDPKVISMSLEKRIKPRVAVIRFLRSKGLDVCWGWSSLFNWPESLFLQKFEMNYEEEASQLLKLYKETLNSIKKDADI